MRFVHQELILFDKIFRIYSIKMMNKVNFRFLRQARIRNLFTNPMRNYSKVMPSVAEALKGVCMLIVWLI
jgi:hypothetical protein